MIEIFHIEGRRSERVAWLAEELGLPYELVFKPGDLMGSMQMAEAVHSMRIVPVVRDGPSVMIESSAILEYILGKYGEGRFTVPPTSPDYARHLQWLHFAEGSAASRIFHDYILRTVPQEYWSLLARSGFGGAARVMAMVESALESAPYFGGESFTTADIMMHFTIKSARILGIDLSQYSRVSEWLQRVEERPAFVRTMSRCGSAGDLSAIVPPLLGVTCP